MNEAQLAKAERYRRLNKTAQKGQIIFAGSSLMEQFPIERFAQQDGLPFPVYNRGISGIVTQDLLDHIDVCILELAPRKLFINIGTNDFNVPTASVDAVIGNYARILDIVKARLPGCGIHIMAYYPVNAAAAPAALRPRLTNVRTNEKLGRANAALALLAKEKGAAFIDANAPITDAQGNLKKEYAVDGIHFSEEGYRAVYPLIKPFLTV